MPIKVLKTFKCTILLCANLMNEPLVFGHLLSTHTVSPPILWMIFKKKLYF